MRSTFSVARRFASALPVRSATRQMASAAVASGSRSTSSMPRWAPFAVAGGLAAALTTWSISQSTASADAAHPTGLNPKEFVSLTLAKRIKYNHNTDVFVFQLKDKEATLDLPVASYLVTKFKGADGKDVIRPYTPIDQHIKGELHLLIKDYEKGVMSKHIHSLKVGDALEIKGPLPKFDYKANSKKALGMVAGGTGITPMLQIIEEIISNPADKTQVNLLFANISSKDILLRERLDDIAKKHKNIQVTYLIDKPENGWNGATGYITPQILSKTMPKPSGDNMIFVCGPPPMMKVVSGTKTPKYEQGEVEGALKELGYDSTNVFKV